MDVREIKYPEYSIYKQGVTQSILSRLDCPMKLKLYLNGFVKKDKIKNVGFGSAFHDLLAFIYNYYMECDTDMNNKLLNKFVNSLIKKYFYNYDDKDREIYKIKLKFAIRFYMQIFNRDWIISNLHKPEREFDVIDNNGVRRRGKIDMELEDDKKRLWLMEHKTMGRINEGQLMNHLSINFQNYYYLSTREIETGKKFSGMVYNIIRNTRMKPKKDETLSEWERRIRKDYRRRPYHYFKRYKIKLVNDRKSKKGQRELDRFNFELNQMFNTLMYYVNNKIDYKNTFNCVKLYSCEYLEACKSNSLNLYKQENLFSELDNKNKIKKKLVRRKK